MNDNEIKDSIMRNDPILKKWESNFFENQRKGVFNQPNVRPLNFIANNTTYNQLPTILVAAGPSLDKNINSLKKYQDKCIIICAEVILFKLLENGIKPDYVVTIDPSETFTRFLEGCDTADLTYVCPTTVHPSVTSIWKGKIIFFNQLDIPGSYKEKTLKKIEMPGWKSFENRLFVGATMYQLAQLFNPSVVGLVGFDFAFTDNKAYCDGFLERKIIDDINPYGSDTWKESVKSLKEQEVPKDFSVPVNGVEILTTKLFLLYKYVFMQLAIRYRKEVVNCTEGGILTEIQCQPLETFLESNCTTPIKKQSEFIIQKRKSHRK